MNFVLITAKHTNKELEAIVEKVLQENPFYVKQMDELYKSFRWVEIDSQTECEMYAILSDKTLEKLAVIYNNLGITWTFKDITREVLYYDRDKVMSEKKFSEKLCKLIYEFITENTDIDLVLEKISHYGGSEHLNAYDLQILESFSQT